MVRSRAQLAAENLFFRKQLACYIERQVRPRRTDNASRMTLVLPVSIRRMARALDDCASRYARALAPRSLSLVLAPKVPSTWAPSHSHGVGATHRRDGDKQPYLGRGAYRGGTSAVRPSLRLSVCQFARCLPRTTVGCAAPSRYSMIAIRSWRTWRPPWTCHGSPLLL
jgi:hypothetical protein